MLCCRSKKTRFSAHLGATFVPKDNTISTATVVTENNTAPAAVTVDTPTAAAAEAKEYDIIQEKIPPPIQTQNNVQAEQNNTPATAEAVITPKQLQPVCHDLL